MFDIVNLSYRMRTPDDLYAIHSVVSEAITELKIMSTQLSIVSALRVFPCPKGTFKFPILEHRLQAKTEIVKLKLMFSVVPLKCELNFILC